MAGINSHRLLLFLLLVPDTYGYFDVFFEMAACKPQFLYGTNRQRVALPHIGTE